jgi:hypothetical protein
MRTAAIIALSIAGCASNSQRELPAPEYLPQAARELLAERMANHGRDMSDLLWATLFLDHQSVQEIAEHIRSTPRFSRPLSGDATELNASLPKEFFALQDELLLRAGELAESAQKRDPNAMASAYGALNQTCVRCHSIYLGSPPDAITGR